MKFRRPSIASPSSAVNILSGSQTFDLCKPRPHWPRSDCGFGKFSFRQPSVTEDPETLEIPTSRPRINRLPTQLLIIYTSPTFSDNINNNNIPNISLYNIVYQAVATIRNGGLSAMTNHSNAPITVPNSLNISKTFIIYGGGAGTDRLYPGTIYSIFVNAQNDVTNTNGANSSIIYVYTDIDSGQLKELGIKLQ